MGGQSRVVRDRFGPQYLTGRSGHHQTRSSGHKVVLPGNAEGVAQDQATPILGKAGRSSQVTTGWV